MSMFIELVKKVPKDIRKPFPPFNWLDILLIEKFVLFDFEKIGNRFRE